MTTIPGQVSPPTPAWWRAPAVALSLWGLAFGLVVLFVPTALYRPMAVRGDAPVFYAVFHQLGLGRRLYAEVFDHKDPLFYYPYTLAYAASGTAGPMLWDTLLMGGMVAALLSIAARLGLPVPGRLAVAVGFGCLYFLPGIHKPVSSYHQAALLYLVGVRLALADRLFLSGVVFSAAVASRMTMAALCPVLLWLVLCSPRRTAGAGGSRAGGLPFASGCAVGIAAVLALLAIRGELLGYADAIRLNLAYAQLRPPSATDFPRASSLAERSLQVFGAPTLGLAWLLIAFNAGVAYLAWRNQPDADGPMSGTLRGHGPEGRRRRLAVAGVALLTSLGVYAILAVASFWGEHFQPFALAFAFNALAAISALRRRGRCLLAAAVTAAAAAAFWSSALAATAGNPAAQTAGVAVSESCSAIEAGAPRAAHWRAMCSLVAGPWPEGTRFATIQQVGRPMLAGIAPAGLRLGCRLFYQFPWFGPALLEEFLRCLERGDADVVFRTPYYIEMPAFTRRAETALREHFSLARRVGDAEVWVRRPPEPGTPGVPRAAPDAARVGAGHAGHRPATVP